MDHPLVQFADPAPHGILVFRGREILYANPALARTLGFATPAQLVGERLGKLLSASDGKKISSLEKTAAGGKSPRPALEVQGIRQDGGSVWLEWYATPLQWGGRPACQATVVDISSRKETERLLRQSEEKFRTLFEHSLQGVAVYDANRMIFCNPATARMFGYASETDMVGLSPLQFVAPEGRHQIRGQFEAAFAGRNTPSHFEFPGITRGRKNLWIEARATLCQWEGRPAVLGAFVDVTRRREGEAELREKEARYRSLMEQASDGIFLFDPAGTILEANQQVLQMLGYDREELLALDFADLVPPQELEKFKVGVKELRAGKSLMVERTLLRKDGTRLYTEISAKMLDNGSIQSILRDITARKQAERALRDNEQLLRTVFDAIPQSAHVKDTKGRYLQANRAFLETAGMKLEEILGKVPTDLPNRKGRLGRMMAQQDQMVLKNGHVVQVEEHRLTLPSGKTMVREGQKIPLRDTDGTLTGVLSVVDDITERKKTEDALRQSQGLLQTVFDAFPHAVAVKDKRGRYAMVNRGFAESLPLPPEDYLGKLPAALFTRSPKNRRLFAETDRALFETRQTVQVPEHTITLPSGEERIRTGIKVPLKDDKGEVVGLVAVLEDITERKRAETARRASERLFETLFNAIPVCVTVRDKDFRFVLANDALCELISKTRDEFFGKTNAEVGLGSKTEQKEALAQDEWVRKTGNRLVLPQAAATLPNGELQWRHVVKAPLYDDAGQFSGIVSARLDITERVTAERARQDGERLLQAIFDALPVGIAVKDRKLKFLMVNHTFARLARQKMADFAGKTSLEVSAADPVELRAAEVRDRRVLKTGQKVEALQHKVTLPNGEVRWRHEVQAPLRDEKGKISGLVAVRMDVTERVLAEEARRASERLLQTVFDAMPQWVIVKDTESRFLMANRAFAADHGKTPEQLRGMHTLQVPRAPASDRKIYLDTDQEVMETGHSVSVPRLTVRLTDGREQVRHFVKVPLRDPQDNIVGLVVVSEDITERVRAEEARRAGERLLQTVFDTLPVDVLVKDSDLRFLMVNRALAEFYGKPVEEIIGRNFAEVAHATSAQIDQIEADDRHVLETGAVVEVPQQKFLQADGEVRWRRVLKAPLRDAEGKPVGIVAVGVDQGERIRAEEALRANQRLLQTVFDTIPLGVAVKDLQGRYVMTNQAFCDFYEDTPENLVGHTHRELGHGTPEDQTRVEVRTQLVIATGKGAVYSDSPHTTAGGAVKWKQVAAAPLGDEQGKLAGLVVVQQDVTERKKSEQALLQTQKLESLGVLAGGIAHDFNNLLVAILGNAGLAQMRLPDGSPVQEELRQIEFAGERAAELCRQMLAYSGRGKFVLEPVALNRLVEEMANLLQVSISKKVVLKYRLDKSDPTVTGDPSQIQQVTMNLVLNASEALGEHSGVITLLTGLVPPGSELLQGPFVGGEEPKTDGRYVFLEVTDTGPGMSPETVQNIFDPFFTTKFTGRGLGLAAVLGIVRSHGGVMKVRSWPGQGTTFRFLMPGAAAGAAKPAAPPTDPAWRGRGLALVIDDEPTIRDVTGHMLEAVGFSVIFAGDGQAGVEKFRTRSREVRLVLLDLTMPNQGGEETLRQIKEINFEVPVVLMSGYQETEVVTRFGGAGAAAFLQKPFSPKTLAEKLRSLLG